MDNSVFYLADILTWIWPHLNLEMLIVCLRDGMIRMPYSIGNHHNHCKWSSPEVVELVVLELGYFSHSFLSSCA